MSKALVGRGGGILAAVVALLLLWGVLPLASPAASPPGSYLSFLPLVRRAGGSGAVLFSDDFDHGTLSGWRANYGSWVNRDSAMRGEFIIGQAWNLREVVASDLTYEGTVTVQDGLAAGLAFRASPSGARSYQAVLNVRDKAFQLGRVDSGFTTVLASQALDVQLDRPYRIALRAQGSLLEGWLDGARLLTAVDSNYATGQLGVTVAVGVAVFDDLLARSYP